MSIGELEEFDHGIVLQEFNQQPAVESAPLAPQHEQFKSALQQ
jgi:hypothetical protein